METETKQRHELAAAADENRRASDVALETLDSAVSAPPPAGSECPDGGYGWVCVGVCFCVNAFTWGIVAIYGVYLSEYLANDIFPEATSVDFALIGGFQLSFAMAVAPFVTIVGRKTGTKIPMLIGVGILVLAYISASFSRRIWQLYLSQGVLIGIGIGFVYIPSMTIISQWFDKKRSLANGISSAGSGVGGIIFSFVTQAIIDNISLWWAFRITCIVSCTVLLIATLLAKNRNETIKPAQRGFDTKLLRKLDVLLLLSWGFIVMLGYVVLLYSLPNFATSIGLSSSQGATVNAMLNLGTAIGRPTIGFASDRFGRMEVAGVVTLVCGLATFAIWVPANSFGVLIFFALFSGGMLGAYWNTVAPICVEVAGLGELQSMLSLAWLSTVLPLTFSEVIALKIRRPHSSRPYLYPQIFSGVCYICASICMFLLLRRTKVKKRDLQPQS